MEWMIGFRKAYGLSQLQLAQFAGISRTYLSVLEQRHRLPAGLHALFLELKAEFEGADAETNPPAVLTSSQKTTSFCEKLRERLLKKQEQHAALRRQLASLEKRYRHLERLARVCARWKMLKQDSDPGLSIKMGALEAGQKKELRQCGPTAQAKIRIRIAGLEAEIKTISEELKFFLGESV